MFDFVRSLLGFVLRLGLLLAGLVFFASLLTVGLLLLSVWLLRALWAKVTGQPVRPWVFQMNRRPPWERSGRGGGFGGAAASPDADVIDAQARDVTVVTDVEPKRIDTSR
jgi:hypothetical protein